jgi:V/A-type H+-transporting ATPase subunit I
MGLRPTSARWFETYVPRSESVHTLEVLAGTGAVQLATNPRFSAPLDLTRIRMRVYQFETLARRYADNLPAVEACPTGFIGSPEETAADVLHRARTWSTEVERVRERLGQLQQQDERLRLLDEALATISPRLDLAAFVLGDGPLYKGVFACARNAPPVTAPGSAVVEVVHGQRHRFLIVAASADRRDAVEGALGEADCRALRLPAWLGADSEGQRMRMQTRLAQSARRVAAARAALAALQRDERMVSALTDVAALKWYVEHAEMLAAERLFCHVSGWTTARDPHPLQVALDRAGIRGLVRFPDPPPDAQAPVPLPDAWWARPFGLFVEMSGAPGKAEVDPGRVLPFVVPVLFGYMFPDVGHGLVLALVGAALHRRWPQGRFLIPCGIGAMVFGALFGEVFGLHDLLPALWLKPLDNPFQVLAAPLAFGVGLMLIGLVFAGIEARWRGELAVWLLADGAVLVLYAGALAALFTPAALAVVMFGLAWYAIGSLWLAAARPLVGLAASLGHLLESTFQLLVNTLSFVRVGAFALAHAGLSAAVTGLSDGVESPAVAVFVLVVGNAVSIALEGLVVFVQTTRLVLFEFFIRFLHGEGRVFRPLSRPTGRGVS